MEKMNPQTKIIAMNIIICVVSVKLGAVIILLVLNFSYHNLYPRIEIEKLTISDITVNPIPYPLTKSHIVFPKTDPIAPYGPNSSPEINIIPKWGEYPSAKFFPIEK